jgi:hypothetical protein
MAGFSVATNEHLIRSNLWRNDLKEFFEDEMFATRWVDWISDFPDGTTLNIPSIGQAEVLDYDEGQAIRYTAMDTGNFTFTINQYKSSATYVYRKMMQDSYYMNRVVSEFVPKQARALAKVMEADMLNVGPEAQTASDLNVINGADHRWVASGTNEVIVPQDFAKARYALQKANVPMTNLVAIVDPSVEYAISTMTNLVNLSNNKQWEGIVRDGVSTGMQFRFNIFGFDVYVSQNLKTLAASETIDSVTAAAGVCNLFFSADSSALPIIGAVRQSPTVDSEFNKDLQREEYVTTCRYDFKLYRPENMVVVISDTDQV